MRDACIVNSCNVDSETFSSATVCGNQFKTADTFVTGCTVCCLQAVPQLFVGTLHRLENAVEVLASEITRAFKQQGRALPPWRTHRSMLSK